MKDTIIQTTSSGVGVGTSPGVATYGFAVDVGLPTFIGDICNFSAGIDMPQNHIYCQTSPMSIYQTGATWPGTSSDKTASGSFYNDHITLQGYAIFTDVVANKSSYVGTARTAGP